MVVGHFLKWAAHARVAERAAAAHALAIAYVGGELGFEDRCAAEAAMTLLLDDPSSKVRAALADALSMSRAAPPHLVAALAADQPEVAGFVIGRSPLLSDSDLIDRVAAGTAAQQRLVAARSTVSMPVAAAIAEVGEAEACIELARNPGAAVAGISFRRMAERHGKNGELREALALRPDLPADCRHLLLLELGRTLQAAPLVRGLIGAARAARVARDACLSASLVLIERTPAEEHAALVEHLRLSGSLTAAFMVRAVAHGKIDFFGAALAALSAREEARVNGLLAGGHDVALAALFSRAGLAAPTHPVLLRGLKAWRDVARGRRRAGVQEVAWRMLQEAGPCADQALVGLLNSIHRDALRENARCHAAALAAAA